MRPAHKADDRGILGAGRDRERNAAGGDAAAIECQRILPDGPLRLTRRKTVTPEKNFVRSPLFSVGEAAQYLGVGRKVLYRLIEEGRLKGVKAGGAMRIEKQSLDEFKARGELT